ncbi:unnamed protein product [Clavelina lepadiformis]|uniref:Uncharacterized protein n=1 Tax=Clavelina lepadiformis TaxID=159417 RepID=A0ABP0F8Z1_CLALP
MHILEMKLKLFIWFFICFSPMKCLTQDNVTSPMIEEDTTHEWSYENEDYTTSPNYEDITEENGPYESPNELKGCNNLLDFLYDVAEIVHEEPMANSTQTIVAFCSHDLNLDCINERYACFKGQWHKISPSSINDCDVPPLAQNAAAYGPDTRELSNARYFCDPGFITTDNTLTTCYKGEWNLNPLPTCSEPEIGCGNPKFLPNGQMSGLKTIFFPGDEIYYHCNDGFVFDSPDNDISSCLLGNTWSLETDFNSFPKCKRDCGLPPDTANSSIRVSLTFVGSTAQYICDPGLITNDPVISVCGEDGAWNLNPLPKCIIPKTGCGNPLPLQNGNFSNSLSFEVSAKVTYVCNEGFRLIAPFGRQSTCEFGNTWSLEVEEKFPKCQPDCSKIPRAPRGGKYLIDGEVIGQDERFEDEVFISFACQENYVMFVNATLYCKEGAWQWIKDGEETGPPICGIDCGPPPKLSNAALHLTSTTEGSEAHYVCDTGFYTTDKTVFYCRVDGKWSFKSLPSCLLSTFGCGNPPWLENGRYLTGFDDEWRTIKPPFAEGKTITYDCDDGYNLIAQNGSISTCQIGNKWSLKIGSPDFPKCQSNCVLPDPVFQEYSYDGHAKGTEIFHWFQEHAIESDQSICNGKFWVPPRINSIFPCTSPPSVDNATIISTSESSVLYICDPGFTTIDVTESFCLSNALWDLSSLPSCFVPITGCGNPPTLFNGFYFGESPYDEGETITYQCDEGFIPIAPNGLVNTCNGKNSWSQISHSEGFPECSAVCNNLPFLPEIGKIVKYPELDTNGFYLSGSTLNFFCSDRFPLPLTCREGIWFPQYWNDPNFSCYSTQFTLIFDLANGPLVTVQSKAEVDDSNSSDASPLINLTQYLCEFPGFCRSSRFEIVTECRNTTLISCDACGMVGAAIFLSFAVLLGLAILVGNALVIMVEVRRYRRNAINKIGICKCSLAFADILTGLQILVLVVYNFSWTMNSTSYELIQEQLALRGSPVAYVFGCLFVFGLMSSLYHLVYMGCQRIFAVTKPLKYKLQGKKAVYLGLLIVWILSIISSTVLAWFPDKFTFTYFASTFLYYPTLKDMANDTNFTASIILLVVFYIFPYLLMTGLCIGSAIIVFRNVKLMASKLTSEQQSQRAKSVAATRKRQLTIMVTVTIMQVGFTITLIPIVVVVALHYAHYFNCTQLALAHMITFYLSMANSFVNVPIYSLRDRDFRLEIANIFGNGSTPGTKSSVTKSTTA